MSILRKQRTPTIFGAVQAQPAQPERVVCPPAPPGFSYIVVGGQYRLVSRPGLPAPAAAPPPANCRQVPVFVGSTTPTPGNPSQNAGGAQYVFVTVCNGGGTVGSFGP